MNKESIKRNLRILKRKKWPIALSVLLIVALVVTPLAYSLIKEQIRFSAKAPISLSDGFVKTTDRSKIKLIAHRGFSCQAPENTIPAIEKASEYGFDTVEIDVQPTEDGVWVVSHDSNIKKITDGSGRISNKTYYDLVTANIDKGANHKDYENLKMPTLEHLLEACLEKNIKPMIEIKGFTNDTIDTLLDIIEKNGFTKSCSIISFDRALLETIQKKNPDITLFKLVDTLTNKEIKNALNNKSIGISFNANKKLNTQSKIKKLQNAGIPLVCWTVDDIETMQKMYSLGITDFVTNRIFDKK